MIVFVCFDVAISILFRVINECLFLELIVEGQTRSSWKEMRPILFSRGFEIARFEEKELIIFYSFLPQW